MSLLLIWEKKEPVKSRGRNWTQEEHNYLVENFTRRSDIDAIAKHLGRPSDGVYMKACKLGILGKTWSKEEIRYIKMGITKRLTYVQMARFLKTSPPNVRRKVLSMKEEGLI